MPDLNNVATAVAKDMYIVENDELKAELKIQLRIYCKKSKTSANKNSSSRTSTNNNSDIVLGINTFEIANPVNETDKAKRDIWSRE